MGPMLVSIIRQLPHHKMVVMADLSDGDIREVLQRPRPLVLLPVRSMSGCRYTLYMCAGGLQYLCVCVSGSIFPNSDESARKTYGSPQRCNQMI